MWDRVDLMSFHRLVPAAEELDLAEEAETERERAWWEKATGEREEQDVDVEAPDADQEEPAVDKPELSYGQVLGLLEVELGARPLDD